MWRERGTDQSTEGLYSAGASNNFGNGGSHSGNKRTVLHALRNRYPYNGEQHHTHTGSGLAFCRQTARFLSPSLAGLLQEGAVLLLMLAVYGALLAAIGQNVRLPGSVWTVCLTWICAQAAGFVTAKVCQLAISSALLWCTAVNADCMMYVLCRLGCLLHLAWLRWVCCCRMSLAMCWR